MDVPEKQTETIEPPTPKIPEDLDIKIGTKEEIIWTNVLQNTENTLSEATAQVLVQTEVIKMCKLKIEIEKKKINRKTKPLNTS